MKMTTDIPASITAPDSVETSIGTLEYFDGVPDETTVARASTTISIARAPEAFLNCIPAMSMYSIREGQNGRRHRYQQQDLICDNLMDSTTALWLTGEHLHHVCHGLGSI